MLRVAMISDDFAHGGNIDGGVQAVTKCLSKALARLDEIDLHLVVFERDSDEDGKRTSADYELHRLPRARFGAVTAYKADQIALNRCLSAIQPDVVHSQGAGKYGILATRSMFPSVVTIHGILSEEVQYISDRRRRWRHQFLSWQSEMMCIRRASHFITISPYVTNYYRAKISGECHDISNPIDPAFFNIPRNEDNNRILFAGRLIPLKGVVDLVRAVAALRPKLQPELVLAGAPTDHEYVQTIRGLVAQLGLEKQVFFSGLLNSEQLLTEFSSASCLVLPSYQENAPMVIQEAMACGIPVIASDICGIPFQISDGETGFLVKPRNVSQIADRLYELLSDSDLRNRMGRAGRRKAFDNYRADIVAKETLRVYKHVAGLY